MEGVYVKTLLPYLECVYTATLLPYMESVYTATSVYAATLLPSTPSFSLLQWATNLIYGNQLPYLVPAMASICAPSRNSFLFLLHWATNAPTVCGCAAVEPVDAPIEDVIVDAPVDVTAGDETADDETAGELQGIATCGEARKK